MRSFYRLAVLLLPLLGRVACEDPPASPTKQDSSPSPIYANADEAFRDLLNALPEESLHVALNSLTHFQAGIFESDRHGVERVHNDNPPLATKLIIAAVHDLRKRQNPPSNVTVQSTPTQPSSSAPASSSAPPTSSAVIVAVTVTTTNSKGQTTVTSQDVLSDPTASVAVPVTTTNSQGQTTVSTTTKPAIVFETTDSAGATVTATSAVEFAPTMSQVLTRTDSKGSTFLTTYTPDGGKVSSIVLITTTGANGQPSVITSYTVVGPALATGTNGNPTGTNTAKPGLQSGAAAQNRAMEAVIMGGALGGALAFFM